MIYYVIRHKATGLLMPQSRRERGYSHWNPAVHTTDWSGGMVTALPVPRLIDTRKKANACIKAWFTTQNGRQKIHNSYFGEQDIEVDTKPDGRKLEDLEVVEVELMFIL